MTVQCMITGAVLHIKDEGKWARGDLHRIGSTYVFNAIVWDDAWNYGEIEGPLTDMVISLPYGLDYFERRGVVVFPVTNAALNPAAQRRVCRF
jgi:hypothetical protein